MGENERLKSQLSDMMRRFEEMESTVKGMSSRENKTRQQLEESITQLRAEKEGIQRENTGISNKLEDLQRKS